MSTHAKSPKYVEEVVGVTHAEFLGCMIPKEFLAQLQNHGGKRLAEQVTHGEGASVVEMVKEDLIVALLKSGSARSLPIFHDVASAKVNKHPSCAPT